MRYPDEVKIYHRELCDRYGESDVDNITWEDLEMDEIFDHFNLTKSYIGEQTLYRVMHETNIWEQNSEGNHIDNRKCDEQTIKEEGRNNNLGNKILSSRDKDKLRQKLARIGKLQDSYYLPTFLMHTELWEIKGGLLLRVQQLLLIAFLVGAIVTEQPLCIAGLVLVALCNLVIYVRTKSHYEVYMYSLGSLCDLIEFGKAIHKMDGDNEELTQALYNLKSASRWVNFMHSRKSAALIGDVLALFQDYIFGITLWDVAMFNHIMRLLSDKQEDVLCLYRIAGNVDVQLAIEEYKTTCSNWCEPKQSKEHVISAVGLRHPLIEDAVTNDMNLVDRAIITGANASGKSTYMKAFAINAILAQTLGICTADTFTMPPLKIMTSMSVRDDVITGESYYMREAKHLKRMIDEMNEKPILCAVDEILKGTNTQERIAASTAILEYFQHTDSFILIATHDVELVENVKDNYQCYHFESYIEEHDVLFDYKLQEGYKTGSNALAILGMLDYPQEILHQAKCYLK